MHGVKLEPGHATRHADCGLRKKQQDLSPCDPRLWSCVAVPAGPKRRLSDDRVVQDDSPAGLTLCIKWIEGHLHQAWRVLAPSAPRAHYHMPDYHHYRLIPLVGLVVANWFHLTCWLCIRGGTARTAVMSGLLHRKSHDRLLMSAYIGVKLLLSCVLQKDMLKP